MRGPRVLTVLCVAMSLHVNSALAYDFVPSELEFSSWPRYCQSRYVSTTVGQSQPMARDYPSNVVALDRAELGAVTFEHVHHYCAGLAWFSRARTEGNPDKRARLLEAAGTETLYTYQRIPEQSPIYVSVLSTLAGIEQLSSRFENAMEYLQRATAVRPDSASAYVALALLHREQKNLPAAKATLEQGNKAVEGESVEILYNLGLVLFEMGDEDSAAAYAKRAYDLGYPLPGLRNKLIARNKWPTS